MLENLSNRLEKVFKKLRGYGKLNEENIREALREIRITLLEADVNLTVAKEFIEKIRERSMGASVMKSLTPGQQVVKIVRDELIKLLGGKEAELIRSSKPPTIIMMIGLQGSGKTTTAGKIANLLQKKGEAPLLVAADVYRPAAAEQLKVIGKNIDVPVFDGNGTKEPVKICSDALLFAKEENCRTIIVDTAGRLQIDETMMEEVKKLKEILSPHEILFVADAMIGQEAVNITKEFHEQLGLTGVVLTKLDGDTRGGAVLSIRAVAKVPIKFVGVGEKLDEIESFHPDRMASRIIGMGDILTLIEKAEDSFDQETAQRMESKLRTNRFNLEDFRDQIKQIRKIGSIENVLKMIPGAGKLMKGASASVNEKELDHIEAIINSMTKKERNNPGIIHASQKKRISRGSGTEVREINRLLKQYARSLKMMKQMSKPGFMKKFEMGMGR